MYRTIFCLINVVETESSHMISKRVSFKNTAGLSLSAKIDLPVDQHAHNFILFAHCFTCSKDLNAVRNISRSLTMEGFGVFRFDFTGLGNSDGTFDETNFSSNVQDLVAAAKYMRQELKAPSVLLGHSLGGAAVVFAANQIPEIKALATIGAPADPQHVTKSFKTHLDQIETTGSALVQLAGRPFTITKQLVDDLKARAAKEVIRDLKKAILIIHSPQDETVGIENAKLIYENALHPKSFLSLDGADHLLSDQKDSIYAGEVLASWAKRYIDIPTGEQLNSDHQVVARLGDDGFTTDIKIGPHCLLADEPVEVGGNDFGPNPYELVSAGLAACTAMTMRMYSNRKKWPLDNVEVHISHDKKHCDECGEVESPNQKVDHFFREITIEGDLSNEQRIRLMEIADKCPVHKTLHQNVVVKTSLLP